MVQPVICSDSVVSDHVPANLDLLGLGFKHTIISGVRVVADIRAVYTMSRRKTKNRNVEEIISIKLQ
jgi:hypothetical protein